MKRFRELPIVSTVLVAVNIILFLICTFTGELLYNIGELTRYDVLIQGEYLRLIWAMFLHVDLNHLFNNMLILFFLGSMLEKETGHITLAVIYFLSGIGGNIASLYVKLVDMSDVASVGASGAVFGLDGLLLAVVMMLPSSVPPKRVMAMIILSLYNGFMSANIDNAAHVGGLVVGFVTGMIWCVIHKIRQKNFS